MEGKGVVVHIYLLDSLLTCPGREGGGRSRMGGWKRGVNPGESRSAGDNERERTGRPRRTEIQHEEKK